MTGNNGNTVGDYLGIMVDGSVTASTTPSQYTWVKIKGETGNPGTGIDIKGSVNSLNDLNLIQNPSIGDIYFLDKNIYLWDGNEWSDKGQFKGDDGKSAYQLYVDTVPAGQTPMSLPQWLASLALTYDELTTAQKEELKGAPGTSVSISRAETSYAKHISGTSVPTGDNVWGLNIPSLDSGEYLWTRVTITFSDNTSITSYSVSRNGLNGDTPAISINQSGYWVVNNISTGVKAQGPQGDPGDSITVSQTKAYYAKSNSNTQPNDNLFSETFPTLDLGDYLWTKNVVTFSDNESLTFYTVTRVPNNGSAGRGISSVNISYATNSSPSQAPMGNNVWFDYANMPSVTPGDYLWTRIIFNYTDNTDSSATPIYSVARFGANGSPGGGSDSAQAMTIEANANNSATVNETILPNKLYRYDVPVTNLSITLGTPTTGDVVSEYLLRFKTGSTFTYTLAPHASGVEILYPFDFVLNVNTEYEVSILWDGSKYLVRNCAYQSNS